MQLRSGVTAYYYRQEVQVGASERRHVGLVAELLS